MNRRVFLKLLSKIMEMVYLNRLCNGLWTTLITGGFWRTGRLIGQDAIQFLDDSDVFILQKGSEDEDTFGPFVDLVNLRPDSDGQDYAIIEESHLESSGLIRPSTRYQEINELYDKLVEQLFAQSSTYDQELRSRMLDIILEHKPETLDNGYLIVESEEGVYCFEFPQRNYVLCLLIGDNNAAKIHEMMLRPEDNANRRVYLGKELSIRKWGDAESEFEYTFFFDQRLSWWNSLFGEFQTLEPDSGLHRETFGVQDMDATITIGKWLACDTGLDDLNCIELHKRLRPFTLQAFVPFSGSEYHQIPGLPSHALQRGLRVRVNGGEIIAYEGIFQQIPAQVNPVPRHIVQTPRVSVNENMVHLGFNLHLKKRVMGVINHEFRVLPQSGNLYRQRIINHPP